MMNITKLPENYIFVFGSNLAGRHGKGAALDAAKYFGAVNGQGVGLQGQSFAVPTKNAKLQSLQKFEIKYYIIKYLKPCIIQNPELIFYLTKIGTGLAGYSHKEMAEIFAVLKDCKNVIFPEEWKEFIF